MHAPNQQVAGHRKTSIASTLPSLTDGHAVQRMWVHTLVDGNDSLSNSSPLLRIESYGVFFSLSPPPPVLCLQCVEVAVFALSRDSCELWYPLSPLSDNFPPDPHRQERVNQARASSLLSHNFTLASALGVNPAVIAAHQVFQVEQQASKKKT